MSQGVSIEKVAVNLARDSNLNLLAEISNSEQTSKICKEIFKMLS
jgi:hypothetical protein